MSEKEPRRGRRVVVGSEPIPDKPHTLIFHTDSVYEQRPDLKFVVDLDTGVIGIPGSFYGERSFNGMPIHWQTLDEYKRDLGSKS